MSNLPADLQKKLSSLKLQPTEWLVIVRLSDQTMSVLMNGRELARYPVSTSAKGPGQCEGSMQTPLGLHRIAEKIGEAAQEGAVFKSRVPTGEVWSPESAATGDDLILSRILRLDGLEEGVNHGKDPQGRVVDSHARFIYIHGTNHERGISKPGSHGCVRMNNADVIDLFNRVPAGTLVWIVE